MKNPFCRKLGREGENDAPVGDKEKKRGQTSSLLRVNADAVRCDDCTSRCGHLELNTHRDHRLTKAGSERNKVGKGNGLSGEAPRGVSGNPPNARECFKKFMPKNR